MLVLNRSIPVNIKKQQFIYNNGCGSKAEKKS